MMQTILVAPNNNLVLDCDGFEMWLDAKGIKYEFDETTMHYLKFDNEPKFKSLTSQLTKIKDDITKKYRREHLFRKGEVLDDSDDYEIVIRLRKHVEKLKPANGLKLLFNELVLDYDEMVSLDDPVLIDIVVNYKGEHTLGSFMAVEIPSTMNDYKVVCDHGTDEIFVTPPVNSYHACGMIYNSKKYNTVIATDALVGLDDIMPSEPPIFPVLSNHTMSEYLNKLGRKCKYVDLFDKIYDTSKYSIDLLIKSLEDEFNSYIREVDVKKYNRLRNKEFRKLRQIPEYSNKTDDELEFFISDTIWERIYESDDEIDLEYVFQCREYYLELFSKFIKGRHSKIYNKSETKELLKALEFDTSNLKICRDDPTIIEMVINDEFTDHNFTLIQIPNDLTEYDFIWTYDYGLRREHIIERSVRYYPSNNIHHNSLPMIWLR